MLKTDKHSNTAIARNTDEDIIFFFYKTYSIMMSSLGFLDTIEVL